MARTQRPEAGEGAQQECTESLMARVQGKRELTPQVVL